jgi:uncharacterized small protein (DUF1192 family)
MNLNEIIAAVVAVLSLVSAGYDFYLKWRKERRAFGISSGKIVAGLLVVAGLALGWLGGGYVKSQQITELEQRLTASQAESHDLTTQANYSIALREKSIVFFQSQIQLLSDEIARLKGTGKKDPTARIILFEHPNYEGKRFYFDVGEYPDLQLYWFSGQASSIRLQGKLKAFAYEQADFKGDFLPIDKNMSSLVNSGWNDRIASIKVMRK